MNITLQIGEGSPSTHYTTDEIARHGATDYPVTLTSSTITIDGEITLYRDRDGKMSPCGTPMDVWISAPLARWLYAQSDQVRRAVCGALAHLDSGEVIAYEEIES